MSKARSWWSLLLLVVLLALVALIVRVLMPAGRAASFFHGSRVLVAEASVDQSLLVEDREPGAVVLLQEVIRADQRAQTKLMFGGDRCPFLPVDEW